MSSDGLAVYDHLRLVEAETLPTTEATPGVYRIVGASGDAVTLLRVGDADGRRVNTGEIVSVDDDHLSLFEPADNPDGNRPPAAILASAFDGLGWQLRTFGSSLADRPLLSTLALAAVGSNLA